MLFRSVASSDIANDVNAVSELTENLAGTGKTVEDGAKRLASVAEILKDMVSKFKINS